MTSSDDRFALARREADARYNEALTAFDRATAALSERSATPALEDLARLVTPLIVFLQQITAFVETKDREVAATVGERIVGLERAIDSIAELRTQMTVVQRAVQMLSRERQGGAPAPISQPVVSGQTPVGPGDYKYVGFEDQFRGADEAIEERLREYVPLFAGASDVLDLGCGRGELLAALQSAGIRARGVDANGEMAAIARQRGLDAVQADALTYVTSLGDGLLGGLVATQVVEHLEPSYLMRLIDEASHKLRPGAPIVLETINPACWLAFFSSYLRDLTHVRPIHPDTLQYLLRASGFERVAIRYSAPVPEQVKMKAIDLPASTLSSSDPLATALVAIAQAANANAAILNNLLFTYMDYAAVGYRS